MAHRPNSDRMPVWLWPHKSYLNQLSARFSNTSQATLKWWAEHGMTDLAVGEGYTDDMPEVLDATLALGINANIMPNGGLTSETAFSSEPPDSDVWYRGAGDSGTSAHKLLNPFHPRVIAWHEAENEKLMRHVAGYPHIRMPSSIQRSSTSSPPMPMKMARRCSTAAGFRPGQLGERKICTAGCSCGRRSATASQPIRVQEGKRIGCCQCGNGRDSTSLSTRCAHDQRPIPQLRFTGRLSGNRCNRQLDLHKSRSEADAICRDTAGRMPKHEANSLEHRDAVELSG